MARKARIEGAAAETKHPDSDRMCREALAHNLEAAVAHFQDEYPEEWALLRLCPLQHGLEAMADKLKG